VYKIGALSPYAGLGCDVKHHIYTVDRALCGLWICEIARYTLHTYRFDLGIAPTSQNAHVIPGSAKLLDDSTP
jgi:hypothetical protein